MDQAKDIPLAFWIDGGRDQDLRASMIHELERTGLSAERIPAAVSRKRRRESPAGQQDGASGHPAADQSAARLLAKRIAIRTARQRGAASVLLLDDTAIFHPNFTELLKTISLPDDWGILYLGCTHAVRPAWHSNRLVKVGASTGLHAMMVRCEYFDEVMEVLRVLQMDRTGDPVAAEQDALHALHQRVPAYACHPNLAWSDGEYAVHTGAAPEYDRDGGQLRWSAATRGLIDEAVAGPGVALAPRSKLGLLFLTQGDVFHADVWREFVCESPDRVRVFSHTKNPPATRGGFLDNTQIRTSTPTAWGDISLVRASRDLLLEGLEDPSITHFALLSESCVPVRPLPSVLRRLDLDPRSQFRFQRLHEVSALQMERASALPEVPPGCWRFTPQWWLLNRTAAMLASAQDHTPLFAAMEVPDECYFATVLALQGYPLESEVLNDDVTWTWWEPDSGSPSQWADLPRERFEGLFHSRSIFARKFTRDSSIGRFDLHRTPA